MNPLGIDPNLIEFELPGLGQLAVRWYSLMYVIGYMIGGYLLKRLSLKGFLKLPPFRIEMYLVFLLVGMLLGARLAYVFIYNWGYYQDHINEILMVWKGGLSFHGATVGMALATLLYAKKNQLHFLHLSDAMVMAGSPGLFFGRMGNFINGELYGRVTDSSWGMVFPTGGPLPRHASQLYEGVGEGILLSLLLWFMHTRTRYYGVVSSLFLIGYGSVRFIVEFFRQPDAQLGYYFGHITMGQILCVLMIAVGIFVFFYARKKQLLIELDSTRKNNQKQQKAFQSAMKADRKASSQRR